MRNGTMQAGSTRLRVAALSCLCLRKHGVTMQPDTQAHCVAGDGRNEPGTSLILRSQTYLDSHSIPWQEKIVAQRGAVHVYGNAA